MSWDLKKEDVNAACHAKQGWKVLFQLDNIWFKSVKTKYLKNKMKFFQSKKTSSDSKTWNHISS